jgi:hypothetical protein
MVSDRRCKCKGRKTTYFLEVERKCDGVKLWSRTTYSLEVERERDGVRLRMWMQRKLNDVLPGGGESKMVSDCGPGCEESRTAYFLEVKRERDGVRLWTRMRREQDNVLPGGGEGA